MANYDAEIAKISEIRKPRWYYLDNGKQYWDVEKARFLTPQEIATTGITPNTFGCYPCVPDKKGEQSLEGLRMMLESLGFPVGPELFDLEELRSYALEKANSHTHDAICNGFYYQYGGETLLVSYKETDQINLTNTFNVLQMAVGDIPLAKNIRATAQDGQKRTLAMNKTEFLSLYKAGWEHKNALLMKNDELKAQIQVIDSKEKLLNLVNSLDSSAV